MTRSLLTLMMVTGLAFFANANNPKVPKQVEFANMKLILTDGAQKEIQADVDALVSSPDHFRRKLDLTALYFPIIERVFKEEGVPDDFKYLAIQESGLISDAVSSANAVGYWQFKDFTAREVGLRVDNRIDERKNIAAASRGAAKYMKRNNFPFDNWAYALSAYQAGPGGVKRYTEKKYFGARKMPITKKTHWYLKKYIAHKIAYQDAVGQPHSEGLMLKEYEKCEGKDLSKIAREFKVDEDLLRFYNKWIKNGKVPTDKEYIVLIPVRKNIPSRKLQDDNLPLKNAPITQNIDVPEEEENKPVVYPTEIKPGLENKTVRVKINGVEAVLATRTDDVTKLAALADLKEKTFRKFNDLAPEDKILSGEIYYLERKKNRSEIGFHITLKGESLWDVSQRFGIKMHKLAKKNRISIIDEIVPGQVLWLSRTRPSKLPIAYHEVPDDDIDVVNPPTGQKTVSRSKKPDRIKSRPIVSVSESDAEVADDIYYKEEPAEDVVEEEEKALDDYNTTEKVGKIHTVVAGQTLWSISRMYEVTVDDLMEWNDLTQYDKLKIDQELFVKEPRIRKKPEQKTDTYTVKPGDTLYKIATEYNMDVSTLMHINEKDTSNISVGEELKVYKN